MDVAVNSSPSPPLLSQPTMRIIPEDVWTHIAQFIPDRELSSMLAVNRTLFHLGMDAKYRSIRLDDFSDIDAALKRLHRLRTPAVVDRVRHLSVHLDPRPVDQRDRTHRKGDSWVPSHNVPKLYEVMQAMTNTVACLTNVTKFTFRWTQLPSEEPLGPFFTEVWKTFGSTLQTLTLHAIPPNTLPGLLSTTEDVGSLERLHVEFHQWWLGSLLGPSDSFTIAAGNALAQFANKAAPTLRDLHILANSYEGVPFSFFRHVGDIPNLERLSIVCDTDSSPPDILDLIRFMQTHAITLRHIRWDFPTDGLVLLDYLGAKAFDRVFANLLSLDVLVPWFPRGFDAIVQCISRSADTLTSLILGGHYMTDDEVDTLVSILESRQSGYLQKLEFQVQCLSSELMLLLARRFPCLEQLAVEYAELRAHDVVREINLKGESVELALARNFADAIRKCDIHDWFLLDIKISKESWRVDEGIDSMLMEVVAECVPSVRKFCGVEKQDWRMSQRDTMPYSNHVGL